MTQSDPTNAKSDPNVTDEPRSGNMYRCQGKIVMGPLFIETIRGLEIVTDAQGAMVVDWWESRGA